ncbi:MAG: ATP-dependent RecD-like DNA helicase [Chlorobium sp.]|uniref:SF1B family DNA helicase RecD2 n=1 Tax=Chlorobium sp. TaxID=1095 RepID=UPI002F412036
MDQHASDPKAANDSGQPGEHLTGTVERITYHNEDNGFSVLKIRTSESREPATVVGIIPAVSSGEIVECRGNWQNNRTHGLQFKAEEIVVVPPNTAEGIEKFLASGMVRGIGSFYSKQLVKKFGTGVLDILDNDPEKLLDIPGIGKKRLDIITTSWNEQKTVRDIMVFLQSHGVGIARASRIFKTYREEAISKVTENPYRLSLDIDGIGFLTADTIASKLGIAHDSLIRAEAGVRHVLQELAAKGHCAVPKPRLVSEATAILDIAGPVMEEAIAKETGSCNLMREIVGEDEMYYLAPLHRAEERTAASLAVLLQGAPPWKGIDREKAILQVEKETGLSLSASQKKALATVLTSKAAVITGGPGVGKTTLVNAILRIIRNKITNIALCAPTGRAAKRLSESTGMEARTIHRLLEFDPVSGGFKHGPGNPIKADLIVVDETSMVDIVLMSRLLSALPAKAGLLLVGDADQLPSVGPGAVLTDIIRSGVMPVITLTEIFRQAAESQIIVNAHRINRGDLPLNTETGNLSDFYVVEATSPEEIHRKLMQMVTSRIPERFNLHPVRDIQVLTPMNRGGLGSRALNAELQKALNGSAEPKISRFGTTFSSGDKVLQMVNNYDKEVFNGDIGTITSIDTEESELVVDFERRPVRYGFGELDEISLAYATSIHKSQGSEYPAVVIPLGMQHFTLLERNLIYTAVTRGKKLVVIITQPKALAIAVGNRKAGSRMTTLASRLAEACSDSAGKR